MGYEFIAFAIDIKLSAKGALGREVLGPLIDQAALVAGEGRGLFIALDQILPDLRAHQFGEPADMGQDRIVATQGVVRLHQVQQADKTQKAKNHCGDQGLGSDETGEQEKHGQNQADAKDRIAVEHVFNFPEVRCDSHHNRRNRKASRLDTARF